MDPIILDAGEERVDLLVEIHEWVFIRGGLFASIFLRHICVMIELPERAVDVNLHFLPLGALFIRNCIS